jgi:hypothetical protein
LLVSFFRLYIFPKPMATKAKMFKKFLLLSLDWTRPKDPRVPLGHASILASLKVLLFPLPSHPFFFLLASHCPYFPSLPFHFPFVTFPSFPFPFSYPSLPFPSFPLACFPYPFCFLKQFPFQKKVPHIHVQSVNHPVNAVSIDNLR